MCTTGTTWPSSLSTRPAASSGMRSRSGSSGSWLRAQPTCRTKDRPAWPTRNHRGASRRCNRACRSSECTTTFNVAILSPIEGRDWACTPSRMAFWAAKIDSQRLVEAKTTPLLMLGSDAFSQNALGTAGASAAIQDRMYGPDEIEALLKPQDVPSSATTSTSSPPLSPPRAAAKGWSWNTTSKASAHITCEKCAALSAIHICARTCRAKSTGCMSAAASRSRCGMRCGSPHPSANGHDVRMRSIVTLWRRRWCSRPAGTRSSTSMNSSPPKPVARNDKMNTITSSHLGVTVCVSARESTAYRASKFDAA
mmetsp:Transcript_8866/g.31351  ORF Transcript_8866/g.31351 Transcript_8866/m.31351 type:complete len:310 (-) Transcript_8866:2696-3625(-)